jgi:hypothetical protein
MDYPGKVITKTQVTPTQTSASGNWTLDDQAAAIKNNNWPVAGVPNPISKSLRFNVPDSTYLNRTPASATNRRTWTWSGWVKRSNVASISAMFSALDNSTGGTDVGTAIRFLSNTIDVFDFTNSVYNFQIETTQVFRDVSAWYHIVVAFDTTQATASNRIKLYVNGSQVTTFSTATYPNQNTDWRINNTVAHSIGGLFVDASPTQYLNGYMTEINFVDGQALTPSDFGLTNPQTGQWIPKKYTGTYGTNGFYVNFKDATSTSTLGYDYSGNANNWTANNFSVTAGVDNDSLTDVPTPWFAYNTTGDVGGVIRGNYCTLNPLQTTQSATAPTNGNLTSPANAGVWRRIGATIQLPTTGKWYFEYNCDSFSSFPTFSIGVFSGNIDTSNNAIGFSATEWGYNAQSGYASNNNTNISSGFTTATTGDVLQLAYDASTGSLWFGKNNTWQGASSPNPSTGTSATYSGVYNVSPVMVQNWATQSVNFGQRPFAYTPPTGFRSLCTTNLPATAIGFGLTNQGGNYFNTVLYTGNATTPRAITGYGFGPEFIVQSRRDTGYGLMYFDIVRGTSKRLTSASTAAEDTYNLVSSFDSDGFTMNVSDQGSNASGGTYVAWGWKAGGTGVTNTAGTITSTVSANTTAGFSVVTYTGTGVSASVGHGLGALPQMIIVKRRNSTADWAVYNRTLGANTYLFLNSTAASAAVSGYWQYSTSPGNPTVDWFGVIGGYEVNVSSATYVAYCFAAVPGYSAFGSYTGNGSADGPFVYLGFRPAFLMVKRTDSTGTWVIIDSKRNTYNPENLELYPNTTAAEGNGGTTYIEDFLSNGFKIRQTDTTWNASGGTYIYAAFAESPFQFANAR